MNSPAAQYTKAIVGAEDVTSGKNASATGVIARGNRLVVRFTRPVPDFAAQTTMPFFCAVPPGLPADPEGVGAFPAAGRTTLPSTARESRSCSCGTASTAGPSLSASLTDQYLPRAVPAFDDARIYPLAGPDLQRARSLARGHTRAGKAVLYTFPFPVALAVAQVVRQNLARIGLDVEVKGVPPQGYPERLASPNEPWDIAFWPWAADYVDPYSFLNLRLDGRFIGVSNVSRFDSARYNRLLRQAARLQGRARDRAYGRVDVQLARNAAPMIAFQNPNEPTLVSKRVDRRCIVLRASTCPPSV